MSIDLLAAIANVLAALGVFASLFYLARQVRLANTLARAQVRQRMGEQATGELYVWMNDPDLRACFTVATLTPEQHGKLHYFLLSAMRQREWEWFQLRDGIIREDVQGAYKEVIGLHLGTERTRRWWRKVGKIGFNAEFVAVVDTFIKDRPTITYFDDIRSFDLPDPEAIQPAASERP
ncbi:MAG: hypothetical protein ABIO39_08555 [Caulobacteraceae bacterium]